MIHRYRNAPVASLACFALTLANTVAGQAVAAEYSDLWGKDGEKWTPDSRLPEVSFAGYQCGEKPIPSPAVAANVKDFGAKGDGTTDDTTAFNDAIAATNSGAILVPAGTYKITNLVTINKSNLVLRGEGPDKTTIYIPITLTDVKPNPEAGSNGRSWYSYGSGFLNLSGRASSKSLGTISAAAKRGDNWITVSDVSGIAAGQWVQLSLKDDGPMTLTDYLYGGMISAGLDEGDSKPLRAGGVSFASRVKSVDAGGKRVELERRLPYDIRAAWSPTLSTFEPSVTNSGFENFAIKFPATTWKGHFSELGYNGIQLSGVSHCWVRNITLINAEGGIFTGGADFNTISDIVLTRTADKALYTADRYGTKAGATGHHGIFINSSDNLVTRWDFKTNYVHDISVQGADSHSNVFSNGKALDLSMDHHGDKDHQNVWTNNDIGDGQRWFLSGGAGGPCSGAWETFWNLRSVQKQTYPGKGSYSVAPFGPLSITFVGITASTPSVKTENGKWWEIIAPENLSPQNIHEAQLAKRLANLGPAPGGGAAGAGGSAGNSVSGGSSAGATSGTGSATGGDTGGTTGGTGGATGGVASGATASTSGGSTSATAGTSAAAGSTAPGPGAAGAGTGAGTAGSSSSDADDEGSSGCACSTGTGPGRHGLVALFSLFGLAWAARRRRA